MSRLLMGNLLILLLKKGSGNVTFLNIKNV